MNGYDYEIQEDASGDYDMYGNYYYDEVNEEKEEEEDGEENKEEVNPNV